MVLNPFKKVASSLSGLVHRLAVRLRPSKNQVQQIHSKKKTPLPAKKQEELQALCNQLFKKKELITSGKLQFIGLSKIKKRMGKQWEGLSKIVYDTAEDVMNKYMGKGDIFIRYKDDSYIIIFAHASPKESHQKSVAIAEEIRKRLFELEEEELKDLEIRQAVSQIKTDMLMEADFLDDMFDMVNNEFEYLEEKEEIEFKHDAASKESTSSDIRIQGIDVGTEQHRKQKKQDEASSGEPLSLDFDCAYLPFWDTQRGALTTYMYTIKGEESIPFINHQKAYQGRTQQEKLKLDKAVLTNVAKELESMEQEGRKFYVVCPVQHETLFDYDSYEEYKALLSKIPTSHRKLMMLFITHFGQSIPPKKAYWFAKPLRTLCPYVLAELPLRKDLNFRYIAESGINVASVRLSGKPEEQDTIAQMNSFCSKAKSHKIPKTCVLGVSSLSLTTSAVCAGFDFIAGPAIHDGVDKPDSIHRYQYSDLIKELG